MKAIETEYGGCLFRSRAEARHAVLFDALGVRWGYEVEGYDLDGEWYLPDFYLYGLGTWVEVKGREPDEGEFLKATKLALGGGEPVVLSWGFFDGWRDSLTLWTDGDGRFRSKRGRPWLPFEGWELEDARREARAARF